MSAFWSVSSAIALDATLPRPCLTLLCHWKKLPCRVCCLPGAALLSVRELTGGYAPCSATWGLQGPIKCWRAPTASSEAQAACRSRRLRTSGGPAQSVVTRYSLLKEIAGQSCCAGHLPHADVFCRSSSGVQGSRLELLAACESSMSNTTF